MGVPRISHTQIVQCLHEASVPSSTFAHYVSPYKALEGSITIRLLFAAKEIIELAVVLRCLRSLEGREKEQIAQKLIARGRNSKRCRSKGNEGRLSEIISACTAKGTQEKTSRTLRYRASKMHI
ncbi:hypothetical protein NDU88_003727 [Pleurodeles waltl]|uniref:Uncharacterized protein n=1 Tax=Pleurodeles waltl TaxID=8319 RepID=A0AAV7T6A4_PLEWA|nr:hypothetical protein NDU88_003727 [Pleurodeles waltl]